MADSRLTKFRGRLSSVIDWRVREAYSDERKIVGDLAESMARQSAEFVDQINELKRIIADLESRLKSMEDRANK